MHPWRQTCPNIPSALVWPDRTHGITSLESTIAFSARLPDHVKKTWIRSCTRPGRSSCGLLVTNSWASLHGWHRYMGIALPRTTDRGAKRVEVSPLYCVCRCRLFYCNGMNACSLNKGLSKLEKLKRLMSTRHLVYRRSLKDPSQTSK